MTLPQMRKELDKLQELAAAKLAVERQPRPDTEIARSIAFTLSQAAWGKLSPAKLSKAKAMHFTLFGTPDIDPAV